MRMRSQTTNTAQVDLIGLLALFFNPTYAITLINAQLSEFSTDHHTQACQFSRGQVIT